MTCDSPLTHAAIGKTLAWGPTVRGVRWGEANDKVLFLHEPGSDLDTWGSLPRDLARALNIESLAFDLPGHGLSDDPWQPELLPAVITELATPRRPKRNTIVIAAGETALAALDLAGSLELAGLVCLAPTGTKETSVRSPWAPKLFFAGSRAADDLDLARRLAYACGGWAMVTAVPLAARGTGLLNSGWGQRMAEATVSFVRDCLRPLPDRAPCNVPRSTPAEAVP